MFGEVVVDFTVLDDIHSALFSVFALHHETAYISHLDISGVTPIRKNQSTLLKMCRGRKLSCWSQDIPVCTGSTRYGGRKSFGHHFR